MWLCAVGLIIVVLCIVMAIAEAIANHYGRTLRKYPPYGHPGWYSRSWEPEDWWYDLEPPDAAKADVAWFDD